MENIKLQNVKQAMRLSFMQAPVVETEELNNLFFELTNKCCNLKCTHCYIKRNPFKKEKDFLSLDKIKQSLIMAKKENLKSVYLTGGEPMMHPDFNTILRMCLKISNTTILTNGTFINDKKARFLRKIDDESDFETIYRISFEHFDEQKNDLIRGRGSFRKALFAVQNLYKYDFNPIISITDYYKEPREKMFEGFYELCKKFNFEISKINLKITPYFNSDPNTFRQLETFEFDSNKLDCKNSRIISSKGVFSCPILCNDFRARSGYSVEGCSKKIYLDTEKCYTCVMHKTKAFANDWM